MKICIFAPVGFYGMGGRVQRIVSRLQEDNEIILVDPTYTYNKSGQINAQLNKKNIELIPPSKLKGNVIRRTLEKEKYNLHIIKQIEGLDVCILYDGWGTFFARHYLKKKGVPLIFDYVDKLYLFAKNRYQRYVHNWMVHETMKMCDVVICSAYLLVEEAKAFNSNVYHIPNGAFIMEDIKRINIHNPSVGFVGGFFRSWVDVDMVEKALKDLPHVNFYFIGEGDLEAHLRRLSNEFTNFHLMSTVPYDDVHGWINSFDICMIPFKVNEVSNAVCPLKLFEYWALKKPVIATPTYELKKIANDEVLFASDSEEFIESIKKLLLNEELRYQLGYAGYKKLERYYEWNKLTADYLAVLETVVEDKKAAEENGEKSQWR